MFKRKEINSKAFYYSTCLNAPHALTTRDLVVKENINLIKEYFRVENLIHPNQTHSLNIEVVEENKKDYPNCDALILNDPNTAIFLNFADCTPVLLYDNKNNVAAIAHAGWRGTAGRIAPKTVLKMQEFFNSKPKDITAVIGACISFSEFETYAEALELLKGSVKDQTGLFKDNFANLKGINERQLSEIGVENIDICPYCTVLDNDKFFSYRKENKTSMRHSAIICLKK